MEISVRPTTPADLAEVDALLARAFPRLLKDAYPPSVRVTALPLIARAQPALLASGRYFAAEGEGRLLGVGGWSPDRGRPGLAHIRDVATAPEVVRRGVGRALLERIRTTAGAEGIRAFECLATRNAVPFYASVGFRAEGEVEMALQPGITFPAVLMRLDLAAWRGLS
ncbi:GNAT family N-acetyltransferase [Albibacillus kandeliae]|uniref:GNAT family N-acetyltransferase n=1 Tax=Albibacillus kandeliae TaxID=2174228 RepID=UPI000D6905BA|nr:GNAT family N-acetyltransferase [Albibacillus kandeliae]